MYLSKTERKDIMTAYGCEDSVEGRHYQVGPDTWVYLFEDHDKKYLLIATDYTGDYEFEIFPHLLKLEDGRSEFVLQREIPVKNETSAKKIGNTILFETN